MKFDRTSANLDMLKQKQEISIAEIISFFYNFAEDIEDATGNDISAQEPGDLTILSKRLPWMSLFVSGVYENSKEDIKPGKGKDKLESLKGRLKEIGQLICEADKELDEQRKLLSEIKGQETQLELKQKVINENNNYMADMSRKSEELERRSEILNVQIKEAELGIEQKEQEIKNLSARMDELSLKSADASRLAGERNEAYASIVAAANEVRAELEEKLNQIQEAESVQAELDNQKQDAMARFLKVKADINSVQNEVAIIQRDINDAEVRKQSELSQKELLLEVLNGYGAEKYKESVSSLSDESVRIRKMVDAFEADRALLAQVYSGNAMFLVSDTYLRDKCYVLQQQIAEFKREYAEVLSVLEK